MSDWQVRKVLNRVDTPALVLDANSVRDNIKQMAEFFEPLSAKLRPHFKTHKCSRIARMQMDTGAIGITCAKVGEAEVVANAGIRDILIANQVVGPIKVARLMKLMERQIDIKVTVDDVDNVREFSRATTAMGIELGMLVEVNVGNERCGLAVGDDLVELCRFVDDSPNLVFRGLMGYEGHTVLEEDAERRATETTRAMEALMSAKELVENAGLEVEIVSAGATGTYATTGRFEGVTEVQAGSYVVMDARYKRVCPEFQTAIGVLATIVSMPRKGVAIADAGLKSITTEFGLPEVLDPEGVTVSRLSEEHTILSVPEGVELAVGERVVLLPSHCCTTINLYDEFVLIEGSRERGRWRIEGRGKMR